MSSDGGDEDMERDEEYEEAGFDEEEDEENYSEASEMDAEEEGYDAFDVGNLIRGPDKKVYEISYKVKSVADLQVEQQQLVTRVCPLINEDASTAATLLRHYHWNSDKLAELYWEDPAAARSAAGLDPPSSPTTSSKPLPSAAASSSRITRTKSYPSAIKSEAFECPICCLDIPSSTDPLKPNTLSLGCHHKFCIDCWEGYLNNKIMGEGESGRVECMETGCGRIVGEQVVLGLVGKKVGDRYRELLDRTYVDDNSNLKWCPHPGCEYAIYTADAPARMMDRIVPTVKCGCEKSFCFGCSYAADHRPLTCKYVKLWEKKCADDSETSNWLMANTKECSKCASTIEKNGGCNHMTCKKCKYEFCWVCMADWQSHGTSWYNCNRFDEKEGVNARDKQATSRASLERYLHYFNRWANHEQSARLDKELYMKTEKKMEQMQHTSKLTWIEVQFAKEAVDVLLDARMTLKWTYAMAFYLQKVNSTTLFEDNQANLEQAVEQLSELLEKPIDPITIPALRQQVTNITAFVRKRSDIILHDTLQGHYEGRWEFAT